MVNHLCIVERELIIFLISWCYVYMYINSKFYFVNEKQGKCNINIDRVTIIAISYVIVYVIIDKLETLF